MTRPANMATFIITATLTVACASFYPATMSVAIRPLSGADGGSCTAWAIGPSKWITAAHCTAGVDRIDGQAIEWLAVDTAADLALLRGPASAQVFRVSVREPVMGDAVALYGYGLARPTLLILPGLYIAAQSDFFKGGPSEMLMAGNGMPGMSGGPILWKGKVVSVVTGGAPPPSHAHVLGTGVPWRVLRAFVMRTGAEKD